MGSCFHRIDYFEERGVPAFIASLGTNFILIYSCPECMLHLELATQDSASLHQLSTCVTLYGRVDDLGNFEGCLSDMAVELPAQY